MVLLQLIGVLVIYSGIFILLALVLGIFTKRKFTWVLKTALLGAAAAMLLLFLVASIAHLLLRPVDLDRSDVIGQYEIDRSRYPGKQADWQHATYSLRITRSSAIVRDSRTSTKWEYPIIWYHQPDYRWTFRDAGKRHHMVAEGPDLYRQRSGYHYVFKSPLYGDVFFIKKRAVNP
jgi:hypothetical protein